MSGYGRVLITGAAGQLGHDLYEVFSAQGHQRVVVADRHQLDVTEGPASRRYIEHLAPGIILHAAAFTDVDACEAQPEKAFLVNAQGARNVAAAAERVGAKLVYVSTDYVFDGKKDGPYDEHDVPNPLNIYGKSKLQGEAWASQGCERHFIVRTAWLYGAGGKKSFVKTMLTLAQNGKEIKVVNDQRGTPTWSYDLAQQIKVLVETDGYGTYHASAQGACSWYEFAKAIFEESGQTVAVAPVTSAQFPRPARRPGNSVLDNAHLRECGLDLMPPWRDALVRFLRSQREEGAV